MKRLFFNVAMTLVLVLSLGLVTAVPVSAEAGDTLQVVPFDLAIGEYGGEGDIDCLSEWAVLDGEIAVHLVTGTKETDPAWGDGDEGRIVINASDVEILTLGDIASISWGVSTKAGYSPHIDVTLDVADESADMLTAELACNNVGYTHPPVPGADEWRQTFEMTSGDGYGAIGSDTIFWVTGMGAGTTDAPFGTLAEWQEGAVANDPDTEFPEGVVIDRDTPVLKFEIEADNWIVESVAYVDDIAFNGVTYFGSIQDAVDSAIAGDTINVAAGEYAGAVVNKAVIVKGAEGGASVLTSGVQYRDGKDNLQSAFRPEVDGIEIRNFTINCDGDPDLGVYARGVDGVIVDSLIINTDGTVQGITNWGGSDWEITNNVITNTVTLDGGGIGIFLGAMPPTQYSESTELRECAGNLIQSNMIAATASAETYSCAGIAVCLDLRYGGYENRDGSENVSGNQILDNVIMSTGVNNSVGIEVGAILGNSKDDPLRTNAVAIALLIAEAAVHDNLVQGNEIDGVETGVYFYNVIDLSVIENGIVNSVKNAIYAEHGHSGVAVNYNGIDGNAFGFEHEDSEGMAVYGSIDATNNWWGHSSGAGGVGKGLGDAVSTNVDYEPWLLAEGGDTFDMTLSLPVGWSLVSRDSAITEELFVSVGEEPLFLEYTGAGFVTELSAPSPLKAIYVKTVSGGGVGVNYAVVEPGVIYSRDLVDGWNLISIPSTTATTQAILNQLRYATIGTQQGIGLTTLVSQGEYNQNSDGFNLPAITDTDFNLLPLLSPLDGYWAHLEAAETFEVIPD